MRALAAAASVSVVALAGAGPAAAARADLRVTRVSIGAGSVDPGRTIKLGDITRNFGRAKAGRSRTSYLLSPDATASKSDVRLGSRAVKAIRGRRSSKGSATGRVPSSTKAGSWFVIACADSGRRVRESKERNNCRPSASRLLVNGPSTGPVNANAPVLASCQIMPGDNEWNRDISGDALDPMSDTYIRYMGSSPGADWNLRQDWGTGEEPFYGIPWVAVPRDQPTLPIIYGTDGEDYGDESDPGPYPFPQDIPIEGGSPSSPDPSDGDRHAIALRQGDCKLFETFATMRQRSGFMVSSSATFDLNSNATRTQGWTSADAAGLAILPGLAKYEEVSTGELRHALRFTVPAVQKAWVAPATHYGTRTSQCYPPYGARVRLRAGFDLSGFSGQALVIAKALKKYGLMLADQGSAGYISGTSSAGWDMDSIRQLRSIHGTDLEVVARGPITYKYDASSGACSG